MRVRFAAILCGFLFACPDLHAAACEPVKDASRIAAAGGSVTEILYALGEETRLVAVDTTSNFPAAATELPSVGYVRNLSAEGLLSMSPSLILGEHDMGPDVVLAQIRATGVDVVSVPEDFSAEGVVSKVLCIGRVIGREAEAREYVAKHLEPMRQALAMPGRHEAPPRVAVLLSLREGAPTAAGIETSGEGLLTMAGARNVFDSFSGWKPVSLEHMVTAAPDFIIIPSRGAEAAGGIPGLLADPAIRLTPAGQREQIAVLDGMAMLGFGPRTLAMALEIKRLIER